MSRRPVSTGIWLLRSVLAASGRNLTGDITGVRLDGPGEGRGPESLVIETTAGETSITVVDVRAIMNIHGPRRFPGLLPMRRADGRRWPQALLSYTFDVAFESGGGDGTDGPIPIDDVGKDSIVFTGEGWGHGVGMSQYGAYAMALDGSSYDEILAHYYGGLMPRQARAFVPETVRVGLAWGRGLTTVTASGDFEIWVNGMPLTVAGAGDWRLSAGGGGIAVVPPPDHLDVTTLLSGRAWPR